MALFINVAKSKNIERPTAVTVAIVLSALIVLPVRAANIDWQYCGAPQYKLVNEPRGLFDDIPRETTIEADSIIATNRDVLDLSGNVKFNNEVAAVSTAKARYKISSQRLTTNAGIHFETDYFITKGVSASITVGDREGSIDKAEFWLPRSHMRGSADKVTFVDKNRTRLDQTFFTSCLEGNTDWELRASELIVDTSKNEGVAKHARLTFMSVPIFYFPYLSFALEGRKSGLLTPDFGDSKTTGRYFTLPYYINIAPNRDATVTPYFYQRRGVMIRTENRFLFPTANGEFIFDYLNKDDEPADNNELRERRFYSDFTLRSFPSKGWRFALNYRSVSDDEYLNDFGDGYLASNESYLDRSGEIRYQGEQWEFAAAVQSYQTIDSDILNTELPYQQLPNLHINLREQVLDSGIRYKMDMEYVNFDRKTGVVGRRLDIAPKISWPYAKNAGYIKPSVTMRHTRYLLKNVGSVNSQKIDENPNRSVSQWSLDSGLFLERNVNILGKKHIHTLEPRLYYLYIPYKDQRNTIVDEFTVLNETTNINEVKNREVTFDAGQPQLSYSQLFRDNRFNGIDKIGDANQITLALTSKLITQQGLERLRVSVGKIQYLQNRRVSLPDPDATTVVIQSEVVSDPSSDIVVELNSQWNKQVNAQATFVWGVLDGSRQTAHYRFRYQKDADNMLSVNYRYERGVEEQADATLLWQLRSQWKGMFHIRYSFLDRDEKEPLLESFTGFEYQSCCWAVRILRREYLTENAETNASTWLQLELKGLTRVGNKLRRVFSTGSVTGSY